ncbi:hypothetical protein LINPERHAP1_LOCUS26062, partial [Linum perenne]
MNSASCSKYEAAPVNSIPSPAIVKSRKCNLFHPCSLF